MIDCLFSAESVGEEFGQSVNIWWRYGKIFFSTSLQCETRYTWLVHQSHSLPVCVPAFAGSHCVYSTEGWPGCVDLGGWLYVEMVCPLPTVTHLSTNRARRWLTSLMQLMMLARKSNCCHLWCCEHRTVANVEWCYLVHSKMMVAACEENDLLMFDPHNETLIGSKDAAHNDSVNCVRCVNPS